MPADKSHVGSSNGNNIDSIVSALVDISVDAGRRLVLVNDENDVFDEIHASAHTLLGQQLRRSLEQTLPGPLGAIHRPTETGGHMVRSQLITEVADIAGFSKVFVDIVLDAFLEAIAASIASGDKITIPGWISVETIDRSASSARSLQTDDTAPAPRDEASN